MLFKVPYLQVRSNTLISYALPTEKYIRSTALNDRLTANLVKAETYTGTLRPGAKKRLTKAIEMFAMAVHSQDKQRIFNPVTGKTFNFRFNFITLTVYSTDRSIQGKEAHKTCLEPFLQWMRRVHKVKLYIWKAELQQRGQIHYHITTNTFIPYKDVQNKWNELQRKAGYLDTFFVKYGRYNAPSTHIKKVAKEKNIAGYLTKEIAKTIQNSVSVGGKVWDCSQNLKATNYYTTDDLTGEYSARLQQMVRENKVKLVYTDNCTIFKMTNEPAHNILNARDFLEYNQQLNKVCYDELQTIRKKKPDKFNFELLQQQLPVKKVDFMVIPDLFSTS